MIALVMTSALFTLADLPLFAKFTSKFYLFNTVATQGFLWLAGLAISTSVVSFYHYLMVVRKIYVEPIRDDTTIHVPQLILGVCPVPFVDAIQYSAVALLFSEGVVHMLYSLD